MVLWLPVSSKPVVVWLKLDGFHAVVVWQFSQSFVIPALRWLGTCAALKFVRWQLLQAVGVPVKPLVWQLEHSTVLCAPVSGKCVFEWSKVLVSQLFVLWHIEQSVG